MAYEEGLGGLDCESILPCEEEDANGDRDDAKDE